MRRIVPGLPLLALAFASPLASAAPVTATLNYRLDSSDNLLKTSSNADRALRHVPSVDLQWRRITENLRANAAYSVSLRRYSNLASDLPEESVAPGSMSLGADLFGDRLTVTASHVRSEALGDIRQVDTPDNRSETDQFVLQARYTPSPNPAGGWYLQTDAERSVSSGIIVDSRRVQGTLGFLRRSASGSSWGFDVRSQRVEFDNPALTDVDTREMAVSIQRVLDRVTLSARIGTNEFDRPGQDANSGTLAELSASWRPTPQRTFSVAYNQRFSDRSLQGRGVPLTEQTRADGLFGEALENGSVFEERSLQFAWNETRAKLSGGITLAFSEAEFDGAGADREFANLQTRLGWRFTRRLDFFANANLRRQEVDIREDDRIQVTAGVNLRFGRDTRLRYGYQYEEQDSNGGVDFVERLVFMQLSHTFARQRGGGVRR